MKPIIIGIVGSPDKTPSGKNATIIYDAVRSLLISYEVIPLGILPITPDSYLDNENTPLKKDLYLKSLQLCDGFIFQGGDDPYEYNFEAVKYAYNNDIPVLGICLGMQTMAEVLGGKRTFIDNDSHKVREEYAHNVIIKKDSKLYEIINKEEILVNSRHKEQIIDLEEKYISGKSDNIIEAIEDKEKNFFIGLQWHPENIIDENTKKIVDTFINQIERRRRK